LAKLLENPEYIVVHTAAARFRNVDRDVIDRWHRQKGWTGIGYHFVIINDKHDSVADGTIQEGRDIRTVGAHVRGLNRLAIGICCVGHGDHDEFTAKQKQSLLNLVSDLIDRYDGITVDNVIGHREVNDLIARGIVNREFKTSKSCPGSLIDMDKLRDEIKQFRMQSTAVEEPAGKRRASARQIKTALINLDKIPADMFPNARSELRDFLNHPEVYEFRKS
jgi:N-acetyl-anhydromuramyl-L-alanine amidase AmpD